MQQDEAPTWREQSLATDVDPAGSNEGTSVPQPTRHDSNMNSSSSSELLIFIAPAILAGIIVKAFDIAFLATSYSRLASDLQHFKDGSWVMLTDSICSAVLVPLYTYLLTALGTRRTMLAAYGAFAVGLGLCALSTTFWQLVSSRFAVGVGSSGVTVLSLITMNEIVGLKQLALWESFVLCVEMGTSMAAGPLGAFMYRRFTWHSVFYFEALFAILGVGLVYYAFAQIRSHPQHSQSSLLSKGTSEAPRVDIEGWVLLILAVTIPFVALSLGDNSLSWTNPLEILLLISAPIFMVLFVFFEARVAVDPIINTTPIFNIQFLRVLLQVFCLFAIFNAVAFVIPPYIQVRAFNEHDFEDWALTCVLFGVPTGAIFGGYLVKAETFSVRRIMLANSIPLQCLCVLFVTRVIKPELAQNAPLLVNFGFCIGIWQSCLLYATLSSTHKQWWPQTLALYYLIQTIGGDMGMAGMSSIVRTVAKSGIRSSLGNSEATEQIIADAMQDLESVRLLDEGPRVMILAAFEHAIHTSFFLPCALAALIIVMGTGMNLCQGKAGYEELLHEGSEDEDV